MTTQSCRRRRRVVANYGSRSQPSPVAGASGGIGFRLPHEFARNRRRNLLRNRFPEVHTDLQRLHRLGDVDDRVQLELVDVGELRDAVQ